jgi:RNA polymerase sigma-70 factor (ECF subfamily)
MDEPLDDFEALVQRAVEGEVGALAQLLAGQQVWLAEFVSTRLDRRLASRLDVGDIVQEVLVEAASKLPEYLARSPIPFTAWIRKIAVERMTYVHRVHVVARKRSVRREVSMTGSNGWSSDALSAFHPRSRDKTPSSYVAGKELYGEVARLMKELPDDDQELLRLRFIEQFSAKDVAVSLGITEQAVRMRQLRALRQLRELLEPGGPGDEVI